MDEERIEPGGGFPVKETRFAVAVGSAEAARHARLLIESLRSFGGRLRECPVWVFLLDREGASGGFAGLEGVRVVPLEIEEGFPRYYFAGKVYACSRAEELAGEGVRSLVWLSSQSLIVNPPVLFDLAPSFDAAFRPVHIRNVGSPADEPLDAKILRLKFDVFFHNSKNLWIRIPLLAARDSYPKVFNVNMPFIATCFNIFSAFYGFALPVVARR